MSLIGEKAITHMIMITSPNNLYVIFRGTDAYQFPPFLGERSDEDLWIFTTDLCRSMPLRFHSKKILLLFIIIFLYYMIKLR